MVGPQINSTQTQPPRAQRFAITMPLRYRGTKEGDWHTGQVENISRTGILFRAEQLLGVKTPVELTFELPVEVGGRTGAQVICSGELVRTVLPATTDEPPAMAATIQSYELLRGPELPDP